MRIRKICLTGLILLVCVNTSLLAIEKNSLALISNEKQVESPLQTLGEDHGQLHLMAFDYEHFVYPVKIVAIDGWQVSDDTSINDYRLAAGVHQLLLIPDFSNIDQKQTFMKGFWQEKRVSFNLLERQNIAVTARLTDTEKMQWTVQMYSIELPAKEILISNEMTNIK